MRIKNVLVLLLTMIVLAACSSVADKPVTEPLTEKEKQDLFDGGFLPAAWQLADELAISGLTQITKDYFSEITYRRANNYFRALFDWTPTEAEAEWERLYKAKLDSVPVIMAAYAKDVENNLPEKKYLDVKWRASLQGDGYVTDNADIVFTLTPKKQPIEEFYLTYGLINREDSASVMKFATLLHECNSIHGTHVSKPTEFKSWLQYRDNEIDEEDFNRLTTEQLMKKYYWGMILRIKIGGKWYSKNDYIYSLPVSVRRYWDEEKKSSSWESLWKETCTKDVAQEYFNIEIPDKDDFVEQKREEFAQQLDSLVYEAVQRVKH